MVLSIDLKNRGAAKSSEFGILSSIQMHDGNTTGPPVARLVEPAVDEENHEHMPSYLVEGALVNASRWK